MLLLIAWRNEESLTIARTWHAARLAIPARRDHGWKLSYQSSSATCQYALKILEAMPGKGVAHAVERDFPTYALLSHNGVAFGKLDLLHP